MHNRSVGLAFNMPREPDGTRWRTIFTALRSAVAGNGNTDISIRTLYGTGCHFCCHFLTHRRISFKRLLAYAEDFHLCLIGESNKACTVKFGCIFSCTQGASQLTAGA